MIDLARHMIDLARHMIDLARHMIDLPRDMIDLSRDMVTIAWLQPTFRLIWWMPSKRSIIARLMKSSET